MPVDSRSGKANLDATLEALDPGGSPHESVRGTDVKHELEIKYQYREAGRKKLGTDEAINDPDDLGRRDVLCEEVSVARVGSSVAADEHCECQGSDIALVRVGNMRSPFHPLSVAISPKSFDWASAHSRTHPETPPLNLCGPG